jgi:hypothetical protein
MVCVKNQKLIGRIATLAMIRHLRKRLKSPCWAFSTRTFPSGARMTRGLPLAKNYFSDSFEECLSVKLRMQDAVQFAKYLNNESL